MEYYEKGDIVFAESDKGYFEPALIQKPSKDYSSYRIRFYGSNNTKSVIFGNLKDCNTENLDIYRKIADNSSP